MRTIVLVSILGACSFSSLAPIGAGDATGSDDAGTGSASPILVAIAPATIFVHSNNARVAQIMVTNKTDQIIGTPSFAATGLTVGTISFAPGTCTAGLAPGASCTAMGTLTGTTTGQNEFELIASTGGASGIGTISVTVMPACSSTCGPNGTKNCCQASLVPGNATGATLAGTLFFRSHDGAADNKYPSTADPATVSDFRLDNYEVTVGRFREFVDAGMGTQSAPPLAGEGQHVAIPDSGWDENFFGYLTTTKAALIAALKCSSAGQTWTDTPGTNESLPINCITWYEAMAFCAWDGGYLATEAEWNYAAAAGNEQRAYPWSSPANSTTADCSYANYDSNVPSGQSCVNGTGGTNRVGSESPKGDGKWGQSDLAGNVFEWTLDSSDAIYINPCNDCAHLATSPYRLVRGGQFNSTATDLRTAARYYVMPLERSYFFGVRCARRP